MMPPGRVGVRGIVSAVVADDEHPGVVRVGLLALHPLPEVGQRLVDGPHRVRVVVVLTVVARAIRLVEVEHREARLNVGHALLQRVEHHPILVRGIVGAVRQGDHGVGRGELGAVGRPVAVGQRLDQAGVGHDQDLGAISIVLCADHLEESGQVGAVQTRLVVDGVVGEGHPPPGDHGGVSRRGARGAQVPGLGVARARWQQALPGLGHHLGGGFARSRRGLVAEALFGPHAVHDHQHHGTVHGVTGLTGSQAGEGGDGECGSHGRDLGVTGGA